MPGQLGDLGAGDQAGSTDRPFPRQRDVLLRGAIQVQALPLAVFGDQRDAAAVFPYGVTLGLFGRFAGGVATDFSFWQINGQAESQHGPVRLNLTALLWPLLPFSQAPQMKREDDGATHYQPAHHLRIGLHYEHQLRIGPFSGANALGLLADLAALRVIANRTFGPVELTASLGALYLDLEDPEARARLSDPVCAGSAIRSREGSE